VRGASDDPLILVVAPEPPTWLEHAVGSSTEGVRVFRLWPIARRAGTAWARGRADRRITARFAHRDLLDRLAAARLPRDVQAIYAPSMCARRVFAAAARRSPDIECHLVEDIADLRQLHADLDRAAARHPDAVFLRRHRATPQQLARQEAERVLADVIHVRSHFAQQLRVSSGYPADRIRTIDEPPSLPAQRRLIDADQPTLLLAGLATARAGTYEVLAALDALPTATLLVRAGEGLEPAELLTHPRVRIADAATERTLDGVDIVVAPTWCELHLPQLAMAATLGVPFVATERAAGIVDVASAGRLVEPGDVDGLIGAVQGILGRG